MKNKIQTKMLSVILSAVMIISFLTVPVSAASSGDCGYYTGTVTYTLDDEGLLTISGEGSMGFWQTVSALGTVSPFYGNKDIKRVVVESGVTVIGDAAFYNCTNITSVKIPDTIRNVGSYSFYGCKGLTNVVVPKNTEEIGNNAFYGCTSLTSINIPKSLWGIGKEPFKNCTSLTDIYYEGSEKDWGDIIDYGCNIPSSVVMHYNSTMPETPIDTPMPIPESAITMTEGNDAYTFTVTASVNENAYAYAALYNVDDGLISVKSKPIESDVTDIKIEKSPDNTYAKVFVWNDVLQPLAKAKEFSLTPTEVSPKPTPPLTDEEKQAAIDEAAEKLLDKALGGHTYDSDGNPVWGKGMSRVLKALLVHDELCRTTGYAYDYEVKYNVDNYNAYGALVNHRAVCSGYAVAYRCLMNKVGIKTRYVEGLLYWPGFANATQEHAWNALWMNVEVGDGIGKWYYVDACLDGEIHTYTASHACFCPNPTSFETSHEWNNTYKEEFDGTFAKGYVWDTEFIYDLKTKTFYYLDYVKNENGELVNEIKTLKYNGTNASMKLPNPITYDKNKYFAANNLVKSDDGNYFFYVKLQKAPALTSELPIAVYCPSTGKTYDYTATFTNATMYGIRPDGEELIVESARSGKVKMTIPFPESSTDRTVTIDTNYDGGEKRTISYLNEYWKNGDGLEKIPSRTGYEFIGWYTEPNGGEKVESLMQLDVTDTVYAQWWNKWEITKEASLTTTGTACRKCESITELTETVTLPVLSDTSFWEVIGEDEPTYHKEGWRSYYNSTYGRIKITLPKKEYTIFDAEYINGKWWIVFPDGGEYKVRYEAYDESGALTSSAQRKCIIDIACEVPVVLPLDFVESGTIKVKVYENMDAEEPIFELEYEATE